MADSSPSSGWTDHNVHDPGVTLLQALVYAMGSVGLIAVSAAVIRRRRRRRECGFG